MKTFEEPKIGERDPWLRNACDVEPLFPSSWINAFDDRLPSLRITENNTCFCIYVKAPGSTRKDFRVSIEDKIITITANRKTVAHGRSSVKANKYYNTSNSFTRSFQLPGKTSAERVTAAYRNKTLELYIPKQIPEWKKNIVVK